MTPSEFQSWAREWVEAWNSHDLDRILAHYADEVELVSPLAPRVLGGDQTTVRGRGALREYFRRGLAAFPDLRFELHEVFPGVRSGVLRYTSVRGLAAAEFMEFDAEHRVCRVVAHYHAGDNRPGS